VLSRSAKSSRAVLAIAFTAVAISIVTLVALVYVYVRHGSQLALSQAADSLADTATQVALVVSLFISALPPDEEHHYGHQRAEPIAALIAAVMIGVIAIEVLREAIGAIVTGAQPTMHWSLPVVFGVKAVLKIVLGFVCWKVDSSNRPNPVLRAIFVDARNDSVMSLLTVGGYFAARYGASILDAYLAIPIGLWIMWSAIDLARDTVPLLMGQAPDEERQDEIEALIGDLAGVRGIRKLRMQHVGTELDLDVHIYADPELTLWQANEISREVEQRLIEETDIVHVMVHVAPDGDSAPTSLPAAETEPPEAEED
jgi:cation diffusion facilitator family transporter